MPSRLTVVLLFLTCTSSGPLSYGQQIIGDVPVSWIGSAATADFGQAHYPCDQKGQIFYRLHYRPEGDDQRSVVRVNQDGSTLRFQIPDEKERVGVFAPSNNGVVVVAAPAVDSGTHRYHVYHFDNKGRVVSDHAVPFDFGPDLMAVTSSGGIVVVGVQPPYHAYRKAADLTFGGAVLDANDKLVQLFKFPPTAGGGNYAPVGPILGGDGIVYLYLSDDHSTFVATVRASGRVDIGRGSSQASKDPKYMGRLFGSGVDVEEYFLPLRTGNMMRFDEYDLASAKKLRTKITRFPSFTPITTCYLKDKLVWMANQSDGESQSTHRVTVTLEAVPLHN